jgi:hypothetical protein
MEHSYQNIIRKDFFYKPCLGRSIIFLPGSISEVVLYKSVVPNKHPLPTCRFHENYILLEIRWLQTKSSLLSGLLNRVHINLPQQC